MADYSFSTGITSYPMNGTELHVNMSDNNLYYRFLQLIDEVEALEQEYVEKTKGFNGAVDLKGYPTKPGTDEVDVALLTDDQREALMERTEAIIAVNYDIDQRVKQKLRYVFGDDNDFNAIFQGVNVMAFDGKGNRILSNFLNVITPLIKQSQEAASMEVDTLVGNRAARRAKNRPADGIQS